MQNIRFPTHSAYLGHRSILFIVVTKQSRNFCVACSSLKIKLLIGSLMFEYHTCLHFAFWLTTATHWHAQYLLKYTLKYNLYIKHLMQVVDVDFVQGEHYYLDSFQTERHGWVVNTPASYPRGSKFKFWPGDWLSWLFHDFSTNWVTIRF
jgi:hypothetical protein